MFSWLVNAGYLAGNPLTLSRERRRHVPRVARYLDDDLWIEVKSTVDALPRETPREHLLPALESCPILTNSLTAEALGLIARKHIWRKLANIKPVPSDVNLK